MKTTPRLAAPLCLAALVASSASAGVTETVLFSDSFNRAALGSGDGNGSPAGAGMGSSDWGMNDNALGGTVVQTYTFDESRAGGANQTTDGDSAQMIAGAAQIEFDFASLAATGLKVEFDFNRSTDSAGFIAIAFGLDDTDQIENSNGFNANTFLFLNDGSPNGVEAAALVRQDTFGDPNFGTVELFANPTGPGDAMIFDGAYSNPFNTQHSAVVTIDAPDGFDSGDTGTISMQVDGGTVNSTNFTFDGVSSGYISLYSNIFGSAMDPKFGDIDNLVITGFDVVAPGIPGDFDGDGDVDTDDFGVFVNSFQNSPQGGPPFAPGDFDEDGDVDTDDFGVFVNSFQNFPPPAVAVPEPTALAIVLSAACLGFVRGSRR